MFTQQEITFLKAFVDDQLAECDQETHDLTLAQFLQQQSFLEELQEKLNQLATDNQAATPAGS